MADLQLPWAGSERSRDQGAMIGRGQKGGRRMKQDHGLETEAEQRQIRMTGGVQFVVNIVVVVALEACCVVVCIVLKEFKLRCVAFAGIQCGRLEA